MGAFPRLSRFVPRCPLLSLLGPERGQIGTKELGQTKRGQKGTFHCPRSPCRRPETKIFSKKKTFFFSSYFPTPGKSELTCMFATPGDAAGVCRTAARPGNRPNRRESLSQTKINLLPRMTCKHWDGEHSLQPEVPSPLLTTGVPITMQFPITSPEIATMFGHQSPFLIRRVCTATTTHSALRD